MKKLLGFLVLLPLVSSVSAQIVSVKPSTEIMTQYELSSIDVTLRAQWVNPYSSEDVALDLNIVSPSGKKSVLPGFYVSGESKKASNWNFHFAPKEVGQYQLSVALSDNKKTLGKPISLVMSSKTGTGKGFLQVADLWTLKFDNGNAFRGLGENFGWERRDNDDSKYFKKLHENERFNYDHMIPLLSSQGANFIRTWMIYWNLPIDWKIVDNAKIYKNSTDQFNASGIKRMDELVALLEKNDMYLMLAMDSHAGFIGDAWAQNPYNIVNGGYAKTAEEFFANPSSRQQYKDKLRFIVARWGYSSHIAAWEFFNEVDNVIYASEKPIADALVTDWHKEMSDYLTAIDPFNHIITTSISHRDVAGLNALPNIDLNQRHMYKVTDKVPETLVKYASETKKPYVIGEYGYEWDWSVNFNSIKDEKIDDFKKGLWYGVFSPTPIIPMTWWWEFLDENNATHYFSRVKEINQLILDTATTGLSSLNVSVDSPNVVVLGVNNGSKQFIYLHNKEKNDVTVNVSMSELIGREGARLQLYDAETGFYSNVGAIKKGSPIKVSLNAWDNKVLIVQ